MWLDVLTGAVAVCALGLAIVLLLLARRIAVVTKKIGELITTTVELAKATTEHSKQADRYHQESLRPLCVIDFENSSEEKPFGSAFYGLASPAQRGPSVGQTLSPVVCGRIYNKGRGPATAVTVWLNTRFGKTDDSVAYLTRRLAVTGLIPPGDMAALAIPITEREIMPDWSGTTWVPSHELHAVAQQTYEVVIGYEDLFGNSFRTVHPKGIIQDPRADARTIGEATTQNKIMMEPNKALPIFLRGQQPVRPVNDFKEDMPRVPPVRSSFPSTSA